MVVYDTASCRALHAVRGIICALVFIEVTTHTGKTVHSQASLAIHTGHRMLE